MSIWLCLGRCVAWTLHFGKDTELQDAELGGWTWAERMLLWAARLGGAAGRIQPAGSGPSTEYTVQIYRLNLHLGAKTSTYIVCKCRCSSCRKIRGVPGWRWRMRRMRATLRPSPSGGLCCMTGLQGEATLQRCVAGQEKKNKASSFFSCFFSAQPTDLPQRYPYCRPFLLGSLLRRS